MVANRVLMRKSSNMENMPPHARRASLKSGRKISQQLPRHSLNRIRNRATGVVRSVKRLRVEAVLPTPPATPAADDIQPFDAHTLKQIELARKFVSTAPASLPPRHYPGFGIVQPASLAWIDPSLSSLPVQFVRDSLAEVSKGPSMYGVVSSIRPAQAFPMGALPATSKVLVDNVSTDMPTHMLAVGYLHNPLASNMTLYPIHDIIFAAHCSQWPRLPRNGVETPEAGGQIELPIEILSVPAPSSFHIIQHYLYNHSSAWVLQNILPAIPAHIFNDATPQQRATHAGMGDMLADACTFEQLLRQVYYVTGLRDNLSFLGLADRRLWAALNAAWIILRIALTVKYAQVSA